MREELKLDGPVGDWLVASIGQGAKVVRTERLICGPASPVHLVHAEVGGRSERFVLRMFMDQDWLRAAPDLVTHEAAVLRHAVGHGLPAPEVIASCPDSSACGHPVLLMSFLEGDVCLEPENMDSWLDSIVEMLVSIHAVPHEGVRWEYFSFTDTDRLRVPEWTKQPDLWREAIRVRLAGPPQEQKVFIHRDYHQTNILWRGETLVGVVDWVNACAGPAGVDVAHCCVNLASMCSVDTAESFRKRYEALRGSGFVCHPYWQLDATLDWGTPQPGFYPPWTEYGLSSPGQQAIYDRHDEYLRSVMDRM